MSEIPESDDHRVASAKEWRPPPLDTGHIGEPEDKAERPLIAKSAFRFVVLALVIAALLAAANWQKISTYFKNFRQSNSAISSVDSARRTPIPSTVSASSASPVESQTAASATPAAQPSETVDTSLVDTNRIWIPESTVSPDHRYAVVVPREEEPDESRGRNQVVDLPTKRILAPIDAPTYWEGTQLHMNHAILDPHWSKDGTVLAWVIQGKWSPRAFTLVQIADENVKWQLDVIPAVQKEMLSRTRTAAPENYEAAKNWNAGNGRAFPDGFVVAIETPKDRFSLPLQCRVTLDSNPKRISTAPTDLRASMEAIIQEDGRISFDHFTIEPGTTRSPAPLKAWQPTEQIREIRKADLTKVASDDTLKRLRQQYPAENFGYFAIDPRFGDITGDNQEDAAVWVHYRLSGEASTPSLSDVLVYTLEAGAPKLLGILTGGDRAYGGIESVAIQERKLIVGRFRPESPSSCMSCYGFVETTAYVWDGEKFVSGDVRIRKHEPQPPRAPLPQAQNQTNDLGVLSPKQPGSAKTGSAAIGRPAPPQPKRNSFGMIEGKYLCQYSGADAQRHNEGVDQGNNKLVLWRSTNSNYFLIKGTHFTLVLKHEEEPTRAGRLRGMKRNSNTIQWDGAISPENDSIYTFKPDRVALMEKTNTSDSQTGIAGARENLPTQKWTLRYDAQTFVQVVDGETWALAKATESDAKLAEAQPLAHGQSPLLQPQKPKPVVPSEAPEIGACEKYRATAAWVDHGGATVWILERKSKSVVAMLRGGEEIDALGGFGGSRAVFSRDCKYVSYDVGTASYGHELRLFRISDGPIAENISLETESHGLVEQAWRLLMPTLLNPESERLHAYSRAVAISSDPLAIVFDLSGDYISRSKGQIRFDTTRFRYGVDSKRLEIVPRTD